MKFILDRSIYFGGNKYYGSNSYVNYKIGIKNFFYLDWYKSSYLNKKGWTLGVNIYLFSCRFGTNHSKIKSNFCDRKGITINSIDFNFYLRGLMTCYLTLKMLTRNRLFANNQNRFSDMKFKGAYSTQAT